MEGLITSTDLQRLNALYDAYCSAAMNSKQLSDYDQEFRAYMGEQARLRAMGIIEGVHYYFKTTTAGRGIHSPVLHTSAAP